MNLVLDYIFCLMICIALVLLFNFAITHAESYPVKSIKLKKNIKDIFIMKRYANDADVLNFVEKVVLIISVYFCLLFSHQIFFEKNIVTASDLLVFETLVCFSGLYYVQNRVEKFEHLMLEWRELFYILVLEIFPIPQTNLKGVIVAGMIALVLFRRINKLSMNIDSSFRESLRSVAFILVIGNYFSTYLLISVFVCILLTILMLFVLKLIIYKEEEMIVNIQNFYLFSSLILVGALKFL